MLWTDKLANKLREPVTRHFPKRRVLLNVIDEVWAVDLIDVQHYADDNDNFKYILAIIDVYSKFDWLRVLKQKTGIEVANALKDIIEIAAESQRQSGVTRGQISILSALRN